MAILCFESNYREWRTGQDLTTVGILFGYAFGNIPNAIWFGTHRRAMLMDVLDGICFGLLSGLIFAAFWP